MAKSVSLSATPGTVALPASSVCGISQARIREWAAVPFCRGSSAGDLPDSGTEPVSAASLALAGSFSTAEPRGEPGKRPRLGFNYKVNLPNV